MQKMYILAAALGLRLNDCDARRYDRLISPPLIIPRNGKEVGTHWMTALWVRKGICVAATP